MRMLQELESLLDLAEKTSDKAIEYHKEAESRTTKILVALFSLVAVIIIVMSIFTSLVFKMSDVEQIIVTSFSGFAIVMLIFFIFSQYQMKKELKRKSYIEKELLKELLSMIDDIRKIVYFENALSNIDKALIEMRLKRISFSAE